MIQVRAAMKKMMKFFMIKILDFIKSQDIAIVT
jgi:hypothetical protein